MRWAGGTAAAIVAKRLRGPGLGTAADLLSGKGCLNSAWHVAFYALDACVPTCLVSFEQWDISWLVRGRRLAITELSC